jgi:hypothetical protein
MLISYVCNALIGPHPQEVQALKELMRIQANELRLATEDQKLNGLDGARQRQAVTQEFLQEIMQEIPVSKID